MTSARLALLSNFEVAQQPKDEEWEMHGNKLFLETKLIIASHKITSKNSFPFRLSVKGNISKPVFMCLRLEMAVIVWPRMFYELSFDNVAQ